MGVFNNFGEYNAKEEAARRATVMEEFLTSNKTHLFMTEEQQKPIAKISKTSSGSGSFYSADCPNCGKTKILGSELNSMRAVCNKCYCVFNLEN